MPHFTPEQLTELENVFGLKRKENLIKVRDGHIKPGDLVWWRAEFGPERVTANNIEQLNIERFPELYSIRRPKTKYVD